MTREIINTGTVPNDRQGDTLKEAFTKTNSNFTEVYNYSSNSWINPITSNTWNVIQMTGTSYVEWPADNTASINTYSVYDETPWIDDANTIFFSIPDDPSTNTLITSMTTGDSTYGLSSPLRYVYISGNVYNFGFNYWTRDQVYDAANSRWNLSATALNGISEVPLTLAANTNVDIQIYFTAPPQKWFDPDALGITDFRGAKISYRAYIDGANGFSEIADYSYMVPHYRGNFGTLGSSIVRQLDVQDFSEYAHPQGYSSRRSSIANYITRTRIKSGTTGDYSDYNDINNLQSINLLLEIDKGLAYRNYNSKDPYYFEGDVPGNLHIQWVATVWTGKDW